jgi:hypothetical protein
MSYEQLLELLSAPDVLAYQALGTLTCAIMVLALLFRRRQGAPSDEEASPWLQLSLVFVIISTAILPAIYRLIPVDTLILPWECESILLYYRGFVLKETLEQYAVASVQANPGVLSASGNSLMYGIPTYYLLHKLGWSIFTVRAMAYLLGLLALIPGYFFVRRLFNPNVALIFVMLLAANTHTIFYMGYGVSSTATLFGILFALALCIATIQARWAHRYVLGMLAGMALFAACFNYSTAKIIVVITLAALLVYVLGTLIQGRRSVRSGVAAFVIIAVTVSLFVMERKLNPGADFASARGEQAFVLMQHKDQILNYLGDSPGVRSMDPATMPLSAKVRFLVAVAQQRIPEFVRIFNPMSGITASYPKGSFDAIGMTAYPVGLFPALALGLIALVLSAGYLRSSFTLALMFGGFLPLLLTTRFDTHRSYLLVIPVLMCIAYGLWIPLRRLRGGFVRESLSALFSLAFGAALIAHSWFFMAQRDFHAPKVREYARDAERFVKPGTSVAMHLSCESAALVALHLADAARASSGGNLALWDPSLGSHLIDSQFRTDSVVYERFLNEASKGEAVLLYDAPISQLLSDLQSKPLEVMNTWDGSLGVLVVSPRASHSS